ncbi:polysialyltransferase family glycosyltransferase [Streptomyces axinellae]|uniref:Alpha-2,8-polysialyltransferase family protein n=1 Tax=Streptomyces axinellae TaxID=552788 RepID=A0ABP6D9U3_9ACTN
MRTQIFFASTLYGAATLAAALDAGRFAPADRRLLLVSNNATNPETSHPLNAMPGFERLRSRFDRVLSWNEAIRPFHPGGWSPRADDAPLWERYLRQLWNLDDHPAHTGRTGYTDGPGHTGHTGHTGYTGNDVELVLESIQVAPALTVARLFPDAPIDVYADGLMSYGPTRDKLDPLVGSRVRRLLHLELIPGLTPLLLSEFGVPAEVVPTEAFTAVLAELAQDLPPSATAAPRGAALLLGQYLSALGILSAEEEEQLHLRMLRGVAARGHRKVVFKPHPVAPARYSRALEEAAAELDVELTVLGSPVLAEVLYERMRPALVVGCFSTALLTASAFYGLPAARTGTGQLLERVTPYQNSNRIPVTLVDAVLPDLDDDAAAAFEPRAGSELTALVRAVGFCMQAEVYPELRPEAEHYLSTRLDATTWRYFKRRRLTALALPGAIPRQLAFVPRNRAVRRVARRARALKRSTVG